MSGTNKPMNTSKLNTFNTMWGSPKYGPDDSQSKMQIHGNKFSKEISEEHEPE